MPRLRAVLATLLALTWCSAVWHVDLEALGLILDHHHHPQGSTPHAHHHGPADSHNHHDDHDPVLVRDVVKDDQIRVGASAVLWFAVVGVFVACATNLGRPFGEREPVPIGGRTAPPFRRVWQFVQRCAPESAAPPVWG